METTQEIVKASKTILIVTVLAIVPEFFHSFIMLYPLRRSHLASGVTASVYRQYLNYELWPSFVPRCIRHPRDV